jgi:hypothetical protein
VSRYQSWKRRSGAEGKAAYRYYQCESRTNQSMCDYHTQRAQELEEEVRKRLASLDGDALNPRAVDDTAVLAEWQAKAERLRNRLAQFDRKLDDHLAAAGKGRITGEQLRKLSVATAMDRLRIEEQLDDVERRIQEQADAAARRRWRERAMARLLDGWDELAFEEKQALLRELIERVVVKDDGVEIVLQP